MSLNIHERTLKKLKKTTSKAILSVCRRIAANFFESHRFELYYAFVLKLLLTQKTARFQQVFNLIKVLLEHNEREMMNKIHFVAFLSHPRPRVEASERALL